MDGWMDKISLCNPVKFIYWISYKNEIKIDIFTFPIKVQWCSFRFCVLFISLYIYWLWNKRGSQRFSSLCDHLATVNVSKVAWLVIWSTCLREDLAQEEYHVPLPTGFIVPLPVSPLSPYVCHFVHIDMRIRKDTKLFFGELGFLVLFGVCFLVLYINKNVTPFYFSIKFHWRKVSNRSMFFWTIQAEL
jgi:hypothetical protein